MSLTVTVDFPADLEAELRAMPEGLATVVRENLAVELYRRGKLTHAGLTRTLGVDRFEADGVLKRHGVMLEMSPEEFAAELDDLRKIARK